MGRKSKYQFHLQHKDSNYSKQSETKKELENKREKPRLSLQNQNRRDKNRNPLKKSLKEDTRDFSPIDLKAFLDSNPLDYFSAEKIAYNMLIRKEETALLLKDYVNNNKERQEETRIKNATTSDDLFKILSEKHSPNNSELLISKMLPKEKELIPRILSLLSQEIDDMVLEIVIDFLYQTKSRWINEIETTTATITSPYTISLLCLILGMIGTKDQIPLLWKAYHLLEEHNSYTQGALLGLSLIWDKEHGIPID